MFIIVIATLSMPFLGKKPIDLPPIVSIELIQITDKTNIPFAPKAKKIIEKVKKKEEERVVSEQAPPKKVKKTKTKTVVSVDQNEKIDNETLVAKQRQQLSSHNARDLLALQLDSRLLVPTKHH